MVAKIRSAFSVAMTEYVKWITNPRIIIVGILLIFIWTLAISPLQERALNYGESLNIFEPFIATGNSGILVMLIPSVYLILLSDYPVISRNTMLIISRTGRAPFFIGHLMFIAMTIVTYIGVLLLFSCIITGGAISAEWSHVVTKYESVFPAEAGNFTSQLLPSNLYNQIPMMSALFHTTVLLALYLYLIVMIIYLFKMLHLRSAGLYTAVSVIAIGTATCSLNIPLMWAFPMANTIIWLHYTEILREPIYPIWCTYLYFGILCTAITVANIIVAGKMSLSNTDPEEE